MYIGTLSSTAITTVSAGSLDFVDSSHSFVDTYVKRNLNKPDTKGQADLGAENGVGVKCAAYKVTMVLRLDGALSKESSAAGTGDNLAAAHVVVRRWRDAHLRDQLAICRKRSVKMDRHAQAKNSRHPLVTVWKGGNEDVLQLDDSYDPFQTALHRYEYASYNTTTGNRITESVQTYEA